MIAIIFNSIIYLAKGQAILLKFVEDQYDVLGHFIFLMCFHHLSPLFFAISFSVLSLILLMLLHNDECISYQCLIQAIDNSNMGQQFTSQAEPSLAILKQLQSRFAILQHPLYQSSSNLKLLNDRTTNNKYILRIITTNNELEHQRIEELINKKIANKNNYVTRLEQYFFEHEKSYCGNLSKCYLLFNVQNCIQVRDYFSQRDGQDIEAELIKGLESLTNGLIWLKNMQTPHGNISSQCVYMIDGQFTLSDPWIAPQGMEIIDRFPSPEKLMKINNKLEEYDPNVSDLFSVAMTLLQVAKKEKLQKIYKKNYTLNTELLIQQIDRCKYGKLREVLRYLLLSSENNRRQYLLDQEMKYAILAINGKNQQTAKKNLNGIRRINLMSNRQNVRNPPVFAKPIPVPTQAHQPQHRNFSKENKLQINFAHTEQGKTTVPFNMPERSHFQMIPKQQQEQTRAHSASKLSFNYTPQITLPKPTFLHNPQPYQYKPENPPNYKPYENYPKFNLIPSPPTTAPLSTYTTAPLPTYSQKPNKPSTSTNSNIPTKFVLDSETNTVKKLTHTQLSNYYYDNPINYKSQTQITIDPHSNTSTFPYQSNPNIHYQPRKEGDNQSKKTETTPINQKPPAAPDSNSSEFNEYIHSLDEKINKFQMGVSNAILNTILEIQKTSEGQGKESFRTIEQLKGDRHMNGESRSDSVPIAESQLTGRSQVNIPDSCEPINKANRQSEPMNDSLLIEINRYGSEKIENEKRESEVVSVASYAVANNSDVGANKIQEGENVLNSFSNEDSREERAREEGRTTMIHGTQLESVSNLAIPQEASSQEQSFQSNMQSNKQGEYCEQYFQNGGIYKGLKKNGERNGQGIFYYRDGGYYQGQWKDNKMNGYGRLFYQSGELAYDGQWYRDEFHGRGKIYNDNPDVLTGSFDYRDFREQDQYWKYYEGDISYDAKQGHGKLIFSNGQSYVGEFKADRPHGRGHFHLSNKTVIHGVWSQGKLIKQT